MSELSQSGPAYDSYRRAGVGVYRDAYGHTKVAQQGHHPEALGRAFGQRVELSLCA